MSTDRNSLTNFINGVLYFRITSFEVGPDLFHLFRSRIVSIFLPEEGGITFEEADFFPNRFTDGKWIDNPTKPGPRFYSPCMGFGGEQLPSFHFISPEIVYIKIDPGADAIMYRNPQDAPETEPMKDFEKTNYEKLFEALSARK